ncbi:hypothetical protein [Parasaccharibacter sp. TMW2.1890]|uniref:hypothetical protein n=1 Tax=Parasaccharibacter sp. TMW2.1890 TaxID=2039289 RepID=UPI0020123261|nr:hypothetical protein [Parasaccharibacter sp. TMW2.1890]
MRGQNRSDRQYELERSFLERAKSLLHVCYGKIEFISEQTDRPDAAFLTTEGRLVGIEIVEVDDESLREYFGRMREVQPALFEQLDRIEKGEELNSRPLKKKRVEQGNDCIFKKSKQKYDLYNDYMKNLEKIYEEIYDKKYELHGKEKHGIELILLAHSEFVSNEDDRFETYLCSWTNYHFSVSDCPYSKVIFTSGLTREAKIVFDKTNPNKNRPVLDKEKEKGSTMVRLNAIPADGKPYNIKDQLFNPPVPPSSKKRR